MTLALHFFENTAYMVETDRRRLEIIKQSEYAPHFFLKALYQHNQRYL